MRQRLVKLADERAVKHVHQRQPHRQPGLPAGVDVALAGQRDSLRTSLERPPPQQLSRQRQQKLGRLGEQLWPDLIHIERAAESRVGHTSRTTPSLSKLNAAARSPAASKCRAAAPIWPASIMYCAAAS